MSAAFKFNAIETHYNGYRFRSRLEARWAVFFDALDLQWEYEKEGFQFDNERYLPDFWLPQLDAWIEIKGQEPTLEEFKKVRLLATYTSKVVYIISGNIGLPGDKNGYTIHTEFPPTLGVCKYDLTETGQCIGRQYKPIKASGQVLTILSRLDDVSIRFHLDKDRHLTLRVEEDREPVAGDLDRLPDKLQKQSATLKELLPFIKHYEQELVETLTIEDGWHLEIGQPFNFDKLEWVHCPECGHLDISNVEFSHDGCSKGPGHNMINDSPRLIAAYEAARQARFEFGR